MFIHLHVHSHYSFLDSTLRIGEIVAAACRAKMSAVALTDTNGLYAVVPFIQACREAGLRPIIGAEIVGIAPKEVSSFAFRVSGSKMQDATPFLASHLSPPTSVFRAVVLARDCQGFGELSRLVTHVSLQPSALSLQEGKDDQAICFSPGPRFEGTPLDSLLALSEEHVWILTDSPALLRLLAGRRNVFAELILTVRRRGLCRCLYDLAGELHIPVVATGDVHFARPDDYSLYRLLRAIATQRTVETLDSTTQAENLCYPQNGVVDEEHYFKTADEMAHTFRGLRAALRNTLYIAERCDVEWAVREPPLLGQWQFPRVSASGGLPPRETAFSHLWKATFEGLKQHYRPLTVEATRRLEYELESIARLGFCEYFLAVHEIAEEARRRGFLFLGRGSAANSIVSFALGLTPVDPIRHNLYFERFLNPERRSPPDIDLDFSWKERDAVVRWIFDHFGHDRVALISTHITLQPRQAIREVGKAMGVAPSEIARFTRPIPFWVGSTGILPVLADLPKVFPECRDLPVGEEPWRTILAHAQRLRDFPRHLSIHCGGLLITPKPITDYTPLQRSAKGPIITQMEMHAIEDLGLIKMDILGNCSLGVLSDCLRMLEVGSEKREAGNENTTNFKPPISPIVQIV